MLTNKDIKFVMREIATHMKTDVKTLEADSGVSFNFRDKNLIILGNPNNKGMKRVIEENLFHSELGQVRITRQGDLARVLIDRKSLGMVGLEFIVACGVGWYDRGDEDGKNGNG